MGRKGSAGLTGKATGGAPVKGPGVNMGRKGVTGGKGGSPTGQGRQLVTEHGK
jgi:hypothetical protein